MLKVFTKFISFQVLSLLFFFLHINYFLNFFLDVVYKRPGLFWALKKKSLIFFIKDKNVAFALNFLTILLLVKQC